MGVTCMKKYLKALKRLTEGEVPPRRRLRSMRKAVSYLMGDASGLGFRSVMWYQSRLVSEAGEFTPLYQGRYSNFREGKKLT